MQIKHNDIGWIGTGLMGLPMCNHLIKKGHQIYVYSRTREKSLPLIEAGAIWCDTPKDIVSASTIIITMVGTPKDVREVYFGDAGILKTVQRHHVLVDMTTTSPSLSVEIYKKAAIADAYAVDAPVSGGDVGAQNAALSIMAGGDKEVVEALQPVFDCIAKKVTYFGAAGKGQHAKMCNQIMVAGTMVGICESLLYASKAGLDQNQLLQAIQEGAAKSWLLENLGPRIIDKNDEPGFMVDHFIKDLGIALEESKQMGIILPGLELAEKLYKKTKNLGHGKSGTQALIHALEDMETNSELSC